MFSHEKKEFCRQSWRIWGRLIEAGVEHSNLRETHTWASDLNWHFPLQGLRRVHCWLRINDCAAGFHDVDAHSGSLQPSAHQNYCFEDQLDFRRGLSFIIYCPSPKRFLSFAGSLPMLKVSNWLHCFICLRRTNQFTHHLKRVLPSRTAGEKSGRASSSSLLDHWKSQWRKIGTLHARQNESSRDQGVCSQPVATSLSHSVSKGVIRSQSYHFEAEYIWQEKISPLIQHGHGTSRHATTWYILYSLSSSSFKKIRAPGCAGCVSALRAGAGSHLMFQRRQKSPCSAGRLIASTAALNSSGRLGSGWALWRAVLSVGFCHLMFYFWNFFFLYQMKITSLSLHEDHRSRRPQASAGDVLGGGLDLPRGCPNYPVCLAAQFSLHQEKPFLLSVKEVKRLSGCVSFCCFCNLCIILAAAGSLACVWNGKGLSYNCFYKVGRAYTFSLWEAFRKC